MNGELLIRHGHCDYVGIILLRLGVSRIVCEASIDLTTATFNGGVVREEPQRN